MDIIFTLFPLILLSAPFIIIVIAVFLSKKKNDASYQANDGYSVYRRLCRSRSNRVIAGVCGGIAEYFGWSAMIVRLFFIFSGIGIFAYVIMAIAIPDSDSPLL